jgi:hypothetical protein
MQKQRLVLAVGALVLWVGAAAYLGGVYLNQRIHPVGFGRTFGDEDLRSILLPAPELPAIPPEITGAFIQRRDNTITVETKSLEAGGFVSTSKNQSGPRVEVIVTNGTLIYQETTQPGQPFSAENPTVQQTVEEATLDDLDPQVMITVWGRKSGDRVVAEVLMYSNLAEIKRAIFEDCEICP